MSFDATIIGGGAAGLFCAMQAAKRGKRILVLEKNAQLGRKILVSGGGRCNFTNLEVASENFLSENKYFAKSALARFTNSDFISLVEQKRIPFVEKHKGQLFCKDRSQRILDLLVDGCKRGRVRIEVDCGVTKVEQVNAGFVIDSNRGQFKAKKLVIATGGLSFPKLGASDFGYKIAKQFGLSITNVRPSLVGLKLKRTECAKELSGISMSVKISIADQEFEDDMLFTHTGLSGPAILQASNYWKKDEELTINLLPQIDLSRSLVEETRSQQTILNLIAKQIPRRVATRYIPKSLQQKQVAKLTPQEVNTIIQSLTQRRFAFSDTDGWNRAEVTLGGVSTADIYSEDMQCRKISGLYFIGEVLDVTGWLGGYNFQWAWASGNACANSI